MSEETSGFISYKLEPVNRLRRLTLTVYGCFFFSSRRRHTRLQGDWSSDVCSSDLLAAGCFRAEQPNFQRLRPDRREYPLATHSSRRHRGSIAVRGGNQLSSAASKSPRSEERRVGKEGRSRWSPYH